MAADSYKLSEVKDKNLINFLDSGSSSSYSKQPDQNIPGTKQVTDPDLIRKLEGISNTPDVKTQQPGPGIGEFAKSGLKLLASDIVNIPNTLQRLANAKFTQNDNLNLNPLSVALNLAAKGTGGTLPTYNPQVPQPTTFTQALVQQGVRTLPTMFIPGAGELSAVENAGRLAKLGVGAANILSRAAPQAAYGALTNPNNSVSSGALYGGAQVASDVLPGALKIAAKPISAVTSYFSPSHYMNDILNLIGKGKSVEENGKMFAKDFRKSGLEQRAQGKENYDSIFSDPRVSDSSIYDRAPLGGEKRYIDFPEEKFKDFDEDLKDAHDEFIKNPTAPNAQDLSNEISAAIRPYRNKISRTGGLDSNDLKSYKNLNQLQDSIKKDIVSSLPEDLSNNYEAADQFYKNNVIPYKNDTIKSEMLSGKTKNPKNFSNSFQFPEDDESAILEHMGPEAGHKILYDKLGKLSAQKNPTSFANQLDTLKNEGFGKYFSPELEDAVSKLKSSLIRKQLAQGAVGGLGGLYMGMHEGMGPIGTLGLMAGSAVSTPAVIKKIAQGFPLPRLPTKLENIKNPLSNLPKSIGKGAIKSTLVSSGNALGYNQE